MIGIINNVGVHSARTRDDQKTIKIVNQLSFLIILFALCTGSFNVVLNVPAVGTIVIFSIGIVFMFPILLNGLQKFLPSQILFLTAGYSAIISVSMLFGREMHSHHFLILSPGVSMMILPRERKMHRWFFALLAAPIWFILEYYFQTTGRLLDLGPETMNILMILMDALVLILCIYMFMAFVKQSEKHIDSIEVQKTRLNRLNKDLKDFGYYVAHDLKSPLKSVIGLTQLIEERHSDGFDEDTKEKFQMIKERSAKMDTLVSNILTYSRATEKEDEFKMIDLEVIFEEAIKNIDVPPGFEIISMKRLPKVVGARDPLYQVFTNLISNAIKYNNKKEGKLFIRYQETQEGEVKLEFIDNGIGIDVANHEKIFNKFQTAGKSKSNLSNGLGLSIVKKIIENHGGEIHVESSPGHGANFWFILPA